MTGIKPALIGPVENPDNGDYPGPGHNRSPVLAPSPGPASTPSGVDLSAVMWVEISSRSAPLRRTLLASAPSSSVAQKESRQRFARGERPLKHRGRAPHLVVPPRENPRHQSR